MRIPKINIPKFPDRAISAVSLAVIGAAIVMTVAGIIYYAQQEEQKRAIQEQTSRTDQLIMQVKEISEQNRDLSKQNKELNEQNRNYAYCNAVLIAQYTQTLTPIVIEDLDKCILTSFPREDETGGQATTSDFFQQPLVKNPQQTGSPQTQTPTPTQPNPENPNNPQRPSNNLLTIPNLLEVNTPCFGIGQILFTC